MASNVDVVVFDENEFVAELGIAHEIGDLLENALARLVERVRLSCKNKLNWTIRIVDHGSELLDVGQDQIGALVSGKAAGETDGQSIGAEDTLQALQFFQRFSAALGLSDSTPPHEIDELRLEVEVCFPKLTVIDVFN